MPEILEAVVERIPPPDGDPDKPLAALIFDSWYDSYRGAVVMVRVFDGVLKKGDKIEFMATGRVLRGLDASAASRRTLPCSSSSAQEKSGSSPPTSRARKTPRSATPSRTPRARPRRPLPGFKEVKPMVFAGVFPTDSAEYENLRDALSKLHMNDSSFRFEPDTSDALGFGFRCGFLGLLHMEIIQERLEREYDLDLITTAPSVVYRALKRSGELVLVDNPSKMPPVGDLEHIEEPIMKVTIHTPSEYVGPVVALCEERRGTQKGIHFATQTHVVVTYELPLAEVILDFHDRLKSVSRGYASMDYELTEYREDDLVKLDMLLNGEPLDALSVIVHRANAYPRGRALAQEAQGARAAAAVRSGDPGRHRLQDHQPRDRTRPAQGRHRQVLRRRHQPQAEALEKQKEGKKRMKAVGSVEVPQEAFLAILKIDED